MLFIVRFVPVTGYVIILYILAFFQYSYDERLLHF